MADIRNPVGTELTPAARATPPAATEAARAAQRAFFQAALGQAATSPSPSRSQAVAAAQPTAVRPTITASTPSGRFDPQTAPTKLLRPGSLVDIKV